MHQLNRLRGALSAAGHSHALIHSGTNLFWLTGFTGSFGFAIVGPENAVFITDSRYTLQAQQQVAGFEIRSFSTPRTGTTELNDVCAAIGVTKLGYESPHMLVGTLDTFKDKLGAFELVPLGDLVENLRMIKTSEEVERIQESCKLTDATFSHVCRLIQPGISEYDLQLEIEFFIRRNKAQLSFDPIVVSGVNSARPHGKATEKLLEVGDFLTMDFGAKLDGYCADMTRTVVIGKADDRTREVYDLVLKAQMESMKLMKPGSIAEDVDRRAREVFDELSLAKYFGHGLGHGLGIPVHDTGRLGIGSKTVLEPGQVWTVEPGVYIEGFGGCRIEDNLVITADGHRNLTGSTKEMLVLG